MAELIEMVASWRSVLFVVVVFGFAPGFALRLLVKIYSRDDPRRAELIAELYALRRIERPLFVAEQLETVLFEGLPGRGRAWGAWRQNRRHLRNSAALTVTDPSELLATIDQFSARLTHLGRTGGVLTVRGRWGTGKTTVTNLVVASQQHPRVIHYNPWLKENADSGGHPLAGLAAVIRSGHQELDDLAAAIDGVVSTPTCKVGPSGLAARRAIRRLAHALHELPHPVLILLDDLDRMMADRIRDVLTVVARTRSLPHLVWLMAFDPAVIRPQVSQALYAASSGKDHINLAYSTLRRKPQCPTHAECHPTFSRTLQMMIKYTSTTPPPNLRREPPAQ